MSSSVASPIDSSETIHVQIPETIDLEKSDLSSQIQTKLEKIPSKRDKEGRLLEPTPTDDPKDPLNFATSRKYTILGLVAFVGLLGPLSSSIYIPALLDLAKGLETDATTINATVSIYIFFLGVMPLIWAPFSELIGRRWVYISSSVLYVISTVLCGISPNIGMFICMRILQATGASAAQAVGAGTITDLFFVHERGMALGIFFLGPLVGPVIGPIIGGYVNQYMGWRWIFYIKTIIGGVVVLANFTFLPETIFHRPGPASASDPEQQPTAVSPPPKRRMDNPLRALVLLTSPDVLLISFYVSVAFCLMYLLIAIIPQTFIGLYGFSTGSVGLTFVAGGLGNIVGALTGGRYSDIVLRKLALANGGVREPEMRLKAMLPGIVCVPAGLMLYGWSLNSKLHWMVPLVGSFINSFGLMLIMSSTTTYLVDGYHQYSASVIGANNFLRCIFAAITPLFAVQMEAALGFGWTFTVCAIICFISYLCVLSVDRWGKRWREKTIARFAKQ